MAHLTVHLFLLLLLLPSFMAAADSYHSPEPTDDKVVVTRWAVLIAGSSGYVNYRHQADVCHAYQILKKGGLKDENIIVFMYDDIANNTENPRRGTIINHPNGEDVYAGVPKDYVGKDVNANNFYAVLLGNKSALTGSGSGKVLKSGPDDHVFIYYTDHGAPSLLGMPSPPVVYAADLMSVLKKMHASNSYKSLVFYVEACESGSMFEGLLPEDINIVAVTASNANESSYATYCPGETPEPPVEFHTCLGDLYSVSWLEDRCVYIYMQYIYGAAFRQCHIPCNIVFIRETHDLRKRTLKGQYDYVRNRTSVGHTYELGSHVMQYGDASLNSKFLVSYIGWGLGLGGKNLPNDKSTSATSVNQRDADLVYLWNKFVKSGDGKALKELIDVMSHRLHVDSSMEMVGNILFGSEKGMEVLGTVRPAGQPLVDDWNCLRTMVRAFETYCGSLNRYGLKHTRGLANICNAGITADSMRAASSQACREFPTNPLSSLSKGFSA
ncbi:hypothetical protein Taro_012668 [Colocasia esculenta]|uniref:Legumain prodomain domain-containing protein n=1 Tax=Colocasia esculenta TaxID=4460 RepID=A0A843UDI1_COLES|nr:hypothetical protein [Colocasia esculenta]